MSTVQDTLRDAFYVTVGFGVLAFQRAQVSRVELQKDLDKLGGTLEDRVKVVEERLEGLTDQVEAALDSLEERLPEQAREVLSTARSSAREATEQLSRFVRSAA